MCHGQKSFFLHGLNVVASKRSILEKRMMDTTVKM
jgi:hypothetical protein